MAVNHQELESPNASPGWAQAPSPSVAAALSDMQRQIGAEGHPELPLKDLTTALANMEAASDGEGYAGVADGCRLLLARAEDVAEGSPAAADLRAGLTAWPQAVRRYLQAPGEDAATEDVIQVIRRSGAVPPDAEDELELLRALLAEGSLGDADDAPPPAAPLAEVAPAAPGEAPDSASENAALEDLLGTGEGEPGRAPDASPEAPPQAPLSGGDPSLPAAVREVLELLATELDILDHKTGQTLVVAGEHTDADIRRAALAGLDDHWERFGAAAGVAGMAGLEQACGVLRSNLRALAEDAAPLAPAVAAAIGAWPGNVAAHVAAPGRPQVAAALVENLCDPAWPFPLGAAEAADLATALQHQEMPEADPGVPQRAERASAEDVSLDVPEDVDPDLLDALLQELPGQTEALSEVVQRLQGGGSEDDLAGAQRIAHTLKGAGNTVGVRGIAVLTHAMEDIFLALKRAGVMPPPALAASLVEATDCLEGMGEALAGGGAPPEDADAVLQAILDWANRIDREGVPTAAQGAPESTAANSAAAAPETTAKEPTGARGDPTTDGEDPAAMIRVPAALVDGLLTLVGESMILTVQVRERLRRATAHNRALQSQFHMLAQLGHDLEEVIDVREPAVASTTARADHGFDALELEEYDELYTHSRRLVEAATDARELGVALGSELAELDDMLVVQERLNGQTQETVLRTRMVPVKNVFPRLQRALRQTCRLTGKQAQLHLSGGTTLIDSEVLGNVTDALMHLLRNAVDHGIEDDEVRAARGKGPEGNVWFDFGREGNQLLIRCRDDGGGLDPDAIRDTAEAQGLVAGPQRLGSEDLKRLVLRANFSTRPEVSQTSGRGIGLDAVLTRVTELGGGLVLESEPGGGLTVELRLPVTLISSHALLVRVGRHNVAVANRGVSRILSSDAGELRTLGEELAYHTSEGAYPALRLETLLGMDADQRQADRTERPVLLVQGEAGLAAVLVESLLDSRELVVKPLGRYLPRRRGLVGATILGDGSVAPVLDLPELLRSRDQPELDDVTGHGRDRDPAAELPTALVVDDSFSARRALAQCMQDAGYRVRLARDGLEAADIAAATPPDIVLADLEMPRMNGIELAAHLRARPDTSALPIIMVTSRSTAKHRQQAQEAGVNLYLTKPFSDDHLLEQVRVLTGGR